MNTKFLLLTLVTFLVSTCVFPQISDNQKRLLLYYYSVDTDTKDKYDKIDAYLKIPENLNKSQQCATAAQMLYVATEINEKDYLLGVDGVLNMQMTATELNNFRLKYMSDFKLDLKDAEGNDNYKWDFITLPEPSKTKGGREFYVLSVNNGMSKKEIYENLNLLYRGEVDLIIDAVKKSTEFNEFMYADRIVSICYEHFYRQDCLEKLKDRMHDVIKYSNNDLVFCKSQILKAIESNEPTNNTGNQDYAINIYYYSDDNKEHNNKSEFSKSDGNIYIGFNLSGDCNSISEKEVTFEYHKPDGSIFEGRGKIPPFWDLNHKNCQFSSSKFIGFTKYWVLGTWKIIVFVDGNKIAEATFKLKE